MCRGDRLPTCSLLRLQPGHNPTFLRIAEDFGRQLAEAGVGVVYGGGGSGLMGALAHGAMDGGGEVIGVIPRSMVEREWARHEITELIICETMHERKALMAEHASAFTALPGGLGTLEEIFEVWTWSQLGYHAKPVSFYNVDGFWSPLLASLASYADAGFIRAGDLEAVVVADEVSDLLQRLGLPLKPTAALETRR